MLMHDNRLLLLNPTDNVLVARTRIQAGERVQLEASSPILSADLGIGHKIARQALRAGDKIVKYGAPIGSATCDIPAGAHVHVHNVASDYIPTYTIAPDLTAEGHVA
jgi:altronate dehydratase small subunit